jgi:chromosomal replication initiator protein
LTTSDREVVAALGQALARRIGERRYEYWFLNKTKLSWQDGELTVGVPNRFFEDWVQKTFADEIRAAAADVFGNAPTVRFVIDPELFQAARRAQEEAQSTNAPSAIPLASDTAEEKETSASARELTIPKRARRWHRLDDFVVGACNRVAHAAAVSVVEEPGVSCLVLHGPVGTGKTHLIEGIYAGLRKKHPDWRVVFATSEDFTNRFVQAMRLGKLGGFRKHFRECEALLVDDLHFLVSKPATQEEFLHTFDALHSDGRQLVVTCDCHPRLMEQFTPELTDRLLGGAIWSLMPPDAETRLALLRRKSSGKGTAPWPDNVLRLLTEQLRGNVRELEGALHSISHFSRITKRAIDVSLAREALGELLRHSVRVVQLAEIEEALCRVLRLAGEALQSKQRAWGVCHPRMVAMFLGRKHTTATYSEIGQHFGRRNHSTAVAAEKKVRSWLQENASLALGERKVPVRELIEKVERELLRWG